MKSGFSEVNGVRFYCETDGTGNLLVLVHAGIADCRMWDEQFHVFAQKNQVLRYDGLPVEGTQLTVRVRATGPVQFTVIDQSSGLPQLPEAALTPRPDTFIGSPGPEWVQADPTLVWRTVLFQ